MTCQALVASMESSSYEDGCKNKIQFMKEERTGRDLNVLNLALDVSKGNGSKGWNSSMN